MADEPGKISFGFAREKTHTEAQRHRGTQQERSALLLPPQGAAELSALLPLRDGELPSCSQCHSKEGTLRRGHGLCPALCHM